MTTKPKKKKTDKKPLTPAYRFAAIQRFINEPDWNPDKILGAEARRMADKTNAKRKELKDFVAVLETMPEDKLIHELKEQYINSLWSIALLELATEKRPDIVKRFAGCQIEWPVLCTRNQNETVRRIGLGENHKSKKEKTSWSTDPAVRLIKEANGYFILAKRARRKSTQKLFAAIPKEPLTKNSVRKEWYAFFDKRVRESFWPVIKKLPQFESDTATDGTKYNDALKAILATIETRLGF